ncbi:MAG: EamA family transporter [Solirubrobacteraceae bacterium]
MPIVVIVLVAAALHASWNALVSPASDRVALVATINAISVAICVPVALLAATVHAAAWPELAASAALHLLYNWLLVAAYTDGDFSQVYPLARGTAPPTVAIASAIVLGEGLSAARVGGIVLISAGLFALAIGPRGASRRAVGLAFATGLAIAAYTVCDGVGVRHSGTPTGYVTWLIAASGSLTALTMLHALRRRTGARTSARSLALPGFIAAVFSIVAYGLVLWAQTRGALAVVAGLRETSVVFAALIGALAFREPLPARRVIASVLVALGAVALALG